MATHVSRVLCPSCNSKNDRSIFELDYLSETIQSYLKSFYNLEVLPKDLFEGFKYTLIRCDKCSLVYQKDIPNDDLLSIIYDNWIGSQISYEKLETSYSISYYQSYFTSIINLVHQFDNRDNLKFFDFGFGWSNWMNVVRALGISVTGVELSLERITFAENLGFKPTSWENIPGGKFDFINTDQVFEHIANPLETLKHLSEGLSDQGIIRISVPNGDDNERIIKKMDWFAPKNSLDSLNIVAPLEHINCFTNKAIICMAEKAGLVEYKLKLFPRIEVQDSPTLESGIERVKRGGREVLTGLKSKVLGKEIPTAYYLGNSCNLFFKKKD